MNFKLIQPVRKFEVGDTEPTITLSHVMNLILEADEQITLVSKEGKEEWATKGIVLSFRQRS